MGKNGYVGGSVTAKVDLDTSQFEAAIKDLKDDIATLKKEMKASSTKNTGLQDEVKQLKKEIADLTRQNKTYSESNIKIKEESRKVKGEFQQLNKEIDSLKRKLTTAVSENEKLSNSLKTLKDNNAALETSLNKAIDKLQSSKKVTDGLIKVNDKYEETIKTLKKENKDLGNSLDKLSADLEKTNNELTKSEKSVAKLKGENDSLAQSVDKLKTENNELANSAKKEAQAINSEKQALDNATKSANKHAKAQENVVKSTKKTEAQLKKTNSLQTQFTKDLYNSILKNKGTSKSSVPLIPIYDELKAKYKALVKNKREFEKLFAQGLMSTNTSLFPSRDPDKNVKFDSAGKIANRFGYIDINNLKKPLQEVQTESTKAGKSVEDAMNRGSRSIKNLKVEVNSVKNKLKDLNKTSKQIVNPVQSTSGKHSLKQLTNLTWDTTISQLKNAGQAFKLFDENLKKTTTSTKKTTKEMVSAFTPLEKELTLSLYRIIKSMGGVELPLGEVMQKLRMQYMSTIQDMGSFERKFLKAVDAMGGKLGRRGSGVSRDSVQFGFSDRGFDFINTEDLKGLRELKAILEGVIVEATQTGTNVESSMNKATESTKKFEKEVDKTVKEVKKLNNETKKSNATDSTKHLELDAKGQIKNLDARLGSVKNKIRETTSEFKKLNDETKKDPTKSVKSSMDSSVESTERYKKSILELGQALKSYNEYNPQWYMKGSIAETGLTEQAELNEKWLKDVTESTQAFLKEFSKTPIEVKRGADEIEKAISQFAQFDPLKEFLIEFAKAPIQVKRSVEEIENAIRQFAQFDYKNPRHELENFLRGFSEAKVVVNRSAAEIENAIAKFAGFKTTGITSEMKQYLKVWSEAQITVKRSSEEIKTAMASITNFNTLEQQTNWYNQLFTGLNKVTGQIVRTTEVLRTFNFALLEGIEKETIFYQRTVALASAIQRMNVQGTGNWEGRSQFGYSKYISSINQITQALQKQKQVEASLKAQKIDQYYAKAGAASVKYWNQIRQGTINLNTYKSQMGQINNLLNQQTQRTERLAAAQYRLFQKYHTTNLNTYKANMSEINQKLAEQTKQSSNAEQGIRKTGTSMVKAAHSSRILSNTLYQLRGALLSLKMIFSAMGGMMVWDFGMQIMEGIKTTFAAKNEMEEQLKANAKVGASGLQVFNRELDNTVSKFQKINKYALGETVSAIGLEFELNTKQMSNAMDIVAMLQSEYVRAGRTQEEAALAVKDILQGEFQRLSRETGVGKEELLSYGWNGDTKDVDSILKAVKKAGEDRNWDLFAAKATSLNDVLQITQSRFEEFGADVLQSISPAIVGGFNTILGAVTGLQKGFEGLSTFGQNAVVATSFIGGITTIATVLPMVTRGMGLADIATIGWGKSLGTAVFNLNKATVAQYGFRKALAEVITGTKAEQIATMSSTKAIFGRILGVNQSVMAQKGLLTALVAQKMELKGVEAGATRAAVANGKWYQKVEYLTAGFNKQGKVSDSLGRSLLRTATSWKVLRAAMLGVIGVGIVAWYASMATWADTVRKNIEGMNEVIDNGDSMLKDAQSSVENYENALSKLTKGTKEYARADANLKVARANEKDIKAANDLAKAYKKQHKAAEESIKLRHKEQMARSYELAGLDPTKATERASGWEQKVRAGHQNWVDSMNIYDERLYKASQHINEHVELMKQANLSEEQRLKYIDQYSVKAEEVAENWKKFNQGDMNAGAYAVLGELQLAWIDLWNNEHFLNFWDSVKKTWEDLKPTVYAIKDALVDLGNVLLDFFSTKEGQIVGGIALVGTSLFAVGTKIYHVLGGAKSTIDIIKTLGGKLKDLSGRWKDVGEKAEEANEKMGGDKSTGGIKGEKGKTTGWWDKAQIQQDTQKYARAAVAIAAGMLLMAEAIALMMAPMGALAATGWAFQQMEPQIRKGIEGLKLIAPVIAVFLPPVIALMYIMDKVGGTISENIAHTAIQSAKAIAAGMLLVAEAIVMLVAPMAAIAALGWVNDNILGDNVQKGIDAINLMGEAVMSMAPIVPVFVAAIVIGAVAIGTEGIGLGVMVAGIAIGMLGVAAAILTLVEPLAAIAALGAIFTDLTAVQRGAAAIEACAQAMVYVEQAVGTMALVKWELLAGNLADVIAAITGHNLGDDLVKLTEEGGFLSKMNDFAVAFNAMEFTPVNADRAAALQSAATSMTSLNTALEATKNAINNLPKEFLQSNIANGENPILNTNATATASSDLKVDATATDSTGYFDQLKQPLKELKKFVDDFNGEEFAIQPIDPSRISAITAAADMVTQVNAAVEKVKTAMGGIADAGWNQNMATGGVFAAISGWLGGLTAGTTGGAAGEGGYVSSLGSSLNEMENVIKDLITFDNHISSIVGSGGSGDGSAAGSTVSAMSSMVTAVDQAIQQLSTTLSGAVPTIKSNALGIGTAIKDGIKEGMGDLTSVVVPPLTTAMTSMRNYAGTYGKGVGWQGTNGFKSEFKIKDAVSEELGYALTEMDGKKQEFYDKGYALGNAAAQGFKDGDDSHSPGIMARTMFDEIGYIETAMTDAVPLLYEKSYAMGETIGNSFNPSLGLGGLSVDDLSAFQSGLDQVSYMATNTDMQTSMAFNNMNTNVGTSMTGMTTSVNGAFTNINTNATTSYGKLVTTTRTSLNNMQSQTTKNIGAIRTSWKGMQNALIASAEAIRNQTSQKIHTLESNMASFWRKVQNPATLMGGAGAMDGHTIKRRRMAPKRKTPNIGFAGNFKTGAKATGISNKLKSKRSKQDPSMFAPLFEILGNVPLYAGSSWHFDWAKDIQDSFMKWHTHFGEIYDSKLTVGKFENDDFPVRGDADIFKKYVFDAIGRTHYVGYFNSRYGDDPVAAYNAGGFNCWDGANIVMALASAFGFSSHRVWGSWNGTPHVWAYVDGVGDIDATAIQQRGTFTSSAVRGAKVRPHRNADNNIGNTTNIGDVNVYVTLEGNVDNPEETGRRIADEAGKRIFDILKRSDATGM